MENQIEEHKGNFLFRIKLKLQSFIKSTARGLTKKVIAYPVRTIVIYLVVLLLCSTGLLRMESLKNNDVADLFTPGNSEGHVEKETLEKYFAPSDDSFQIIAVPLASGYTFNTKAWEELLTVERKLMDLRVDELGAGDFCSTLMDGSCLHFSPFMYFDWNLETISSSNKTKTICEHSKNYIPFYYIFGDTADVTVDNCLDPEKGIEKTKALSIFFAISFEKYNSTIPHKWIKEAENILKDYQNESKYWDVYFMSGYGLSNEVERGTLQTMTKLIVSILLVFLLLTVALHEDSWNISFGLAFYALLSVLLACGLGLCISLLVGLPWTTITPVIVFLALGLGVDNCVLLTILYYRGKRHMTHERKMIEAGGEAALFNTLSTLTTVLAFLMGVNSSFKGISTFCLSSAIVMTTVFITTFTLYSALLSITMKKHSETLNKNRKSRRKYRKQSEDLITKFFRTIVSRIFLSNTARVIVLIVFAALLAFAGYEISIIEQGIVPEDAVPEDSFVTAYLGIAREHFKEKVAEMNVVFYDSAIERSTRRVLIDQVIEEMKTVPLVLPSYENPWEIFNKFLEDNNIDPDMASGTRFYLYLLMCIQNNPRIAEHLSIDLDNLQIPASKVKFSLHPDAVQNIEKGEKTLLGAREVLQKYRDEYGVYINMKSYSSMYPYYEMVGIIFNETVLNMITSGLAVVIVLFLLLPPGPSFLAVFCVALADVCILGWIPFTGLNLNAISSTCLVMSVGIAVDFMAHITHAFVETDGDLSGGERAAATVTRMGRSLTTSAFTTFLSVLMLSIVNVPSNRMFFTMMTGVVIFGLLFGMIFLPTILSFVNPGYVKPVQVGTPMTPLPPGEEAAILAKSRSHGLRRHHRRHRKSHKKEEEEEKEKVVSDHESDGTFKDCLSDHGSIVDYHEELPDLDHDIPREIELPPIVHSPKKEEKEEKEEIEEKEEKEEKVDKTEMPKEESKTTAIKKFKRPRDKDKEESPDPIQPPVETPETPTQPESKGLLSSLWSYWSG